MSLDANKLKDASIRDAYKKAGKKINGSEMATIIRAALDKKVVSANEKTDLRKILEHADLTDKARERVDEFLSRSFKLLKGAARKKVVQTIYGAGNVKRICFRDPVHGVHYEPRHYEEIASLIADDDIDVWEYEVAEGYTGKKPLGYYNSSDDNLFIRKVNRTALQRQSTIVHEATHAIQDKSNVKLPRRDAEAAAHVAQAVMLLTVDPTEESLYHRLKRPNILGAARKVLTAKKISVLTEKDFKKMHEDLADAYENDTMNFDSEWYSFFESLAFHLST
ncbi:hypothetical protein NA78x_001048 [Anatilimnocola sp. NA78]|uniref:hypothetical protein n=1 Tax=Anatilimnocola sp. NA78 TaxID=3415683 RepID=UPI003CE55842